MGPLAPSQRSHIFGNLRTHDSGFQGKDNNSSFTWKKYMKKYKLLWGCSQWLYRTNSLHMLIIIIMQKLHKQVSPAHLLDSRQLAGSLDSQPRSQADPYGGPDSQLIVDSSYFKCVVGSLQLLLDSSNTQLAVGSWQLAVGSWQLGVGSWQLAVGSWELVVDSWELVVGSCQLGVGSWQLSVGSWQLSVGSLELAVGSWELAVGSCQLVVVSWQLVVACSWKFVTFKLLSSWSLSLRRQY